MSGRHEETDSDTRGLNQTVLEELRSAVGGNVLVPGDETYDDARAVWNGMIDRRPAVIVGCHGADDVMAGLSRSQAGITCRLRSAVAAITSPGTPSATTA